MSGNLASMRTPVLCVRGVSKDYELHRSAGARFVRQLLGRFSPVRPAVFSAVRDVSFELHLGQAIAVLGRNGAGKSTLLQIISGLLRPSDGSIELPPRVIGLLELGSGFSPEFTGRENIQVNAAILGLTRAEIRARMDEIVAFADIGDYIDQPVRTYSSGMFLRLAFGIATAAAPDLLLVDEVLAVGDIFFRQKCYDRLRVLREQGTAVVLVTHSLVDAAEFCDRGLVLSEGRQAFYGFATDAVQYYVTHEQGARTGQRGARAPSADPAPAVEPTDLADGAWLSHPATLDLRGRAQMGDTAAGQVECVLLTDLEDEPRTTFTQGSWMRVRAAFRTFRPLERALLGALLRNDRSVAVHGRNGLNAEAPVPRDVPAGALLELVFEARLDLELGEYSLSLAIAEVDEETFADRARLPPHELHGRLETLRYLNGAAGVSVIRAPEPRWPASFSHYGIADLPGRIATAQMRDPPAPESPRQQAPAVAALGPAEGGGSH